MVKKELRKFEKLDETESTIVFYAENKASMNHFKTLIFELTEKMDLKICYVTSVKDDPMLAAKNLKIKSFYIGNKTARIKFFITLKAKILITDMPDLEKFHIKRSKIKTVHYVYAFHSVVSTHLVYRKEAFDNFDTILCTGDYQIQEIQERELKYNLKKKKLVECGYSRLDDLVSEYEILKKSNKIEINKNQILIAPSWGENGLIETLGEDIIDKVLESNYKIIFRPHPMTIKKSSGLIKKIRKKYSDNENFIFEDDISTFDSFYSSECVISDWSGVAMEYSFTTKKPVLFIDVPKKMRNSEYEKISFVPLEERIREQIGEILSLNDISHLTDKIHLIIKNKDEYSKVIESIYHEIIFNIGNSAVIAANEILYLMTEQKKNSK